MNILRYNCQGLFLRWPSILCSRTSTYFTIKITQRDRKSCTRSYPHIVGHEDDTIILAGGWLFVVMHYYAIEALCRTESEYIHGPGPRVGRHPGVCSNKATVFVSSCAHGFSVIASKLLGGILIEKSTIETLNLMSRSER